MAETSDAALLQEVLALAKSAALKAGEEIRLAWLKGGAEETKTSDIDLVTDTDRRCEEIILSEIKKRFPDHAIIGEESAGTSKYELTDAPTWTIDPIDGTTNFVHRLALCCVIISFIKAKEVLVGLVYDPKADELFWAVKGQGAYLRLPGGAEVKLSVSKTETIQKAVVCMDPGYSRDPVNVARFCALQAALLCHGIRYIRVFGSTGLVFAYIACGRIDGAFQEGSWEDASNGPKSDGPKIWDFAAGSLLIQEAGGITRELGSDAAAPRPLDLLGRSYFAAATAPLAAELQTAISGAEEQAQMWSDDSSARRKRARQDG